MNNPSAYRRVIAVAAGLVAASLACSAPAASGAATPTFEIAQAVTNTPGAAQNPATEVVTVPSSPVTATTAPPPAPGVTPSATSCLYNSIFVSDITIPDGTEVQVGNTFTKTWRIKNNGCQPWPAGTTLIFVSGNQMAGPASVAVPETAVNGTQDISVNLKAPSPAGDFQGNWQLRTPTGVQFGDKIYVKIKSTNPNPPTDTPAPASGVDFTASYVGGVWSCSSGGATLYMYTAIVQNTGTVELKSGSRALQTPPGTQINNGNSNTIFQTVPTSIDCNASNMLGSSLAPGATAWVSMWTSGTPIAGGSSVRLIIKLCSEDDQGGDCKQVRVNFST